jgi:hypothetical protein
MPFPQVSPQGRSEFLARDGHRGKAPLVRRDLIVDGFDRDLDGFATDGDVDLDLRISEVHLMTAAVAAADDGKAHRATSLIDCVVRSHPLSFDQRRTD